MSTTKQKRVPPEKLTELDCHLFNEGNHHRIYQKLGAHLSTEGRKQGTRFAVWAPNAKAVSVVGEFNQWDGNSNPMQPVGNSGIWEVFIPKVGEGILYKYEIKTPEDHIYLKADPYGFFAEERPNTASKVTDLHSYQWHDQEWIKQRESNNVYHEPMNIYEVHLGSWKRVPEEKDRYLTYREMADELIPYVQQMGYTHIELLPIAEHPFDGSWGYQVIGYFAPTSRFGTPQDFMYLIDQCHQANIGVILDWVGGHFPKDEHGLSYFDGTFLYEHADPRQGEHKEWGTKVFNFERNEVSNFLIANVLFWFDCYHIDGIRVDAVASMLYLDYNRKEGEWIPNEYGGRENIGAIRFLQKMNTALFEYYPGVLSIAEESTAWPGVTRPVYAGGLGFNFKWNMGWMNDSLRYVELDSVFRKYDHHLMTFSIMYAFSENFVLPLSHDEVVHGKHSLLGKMFGDEWQKRATLRAYLTFKMGHPGKKLLFMGGEFGQWREWSEACSLDWHLLEQASHLQLQQFVQTLNHLYRQTPALYSNDFDPSGFEWIDLHDQEHSVFSFVRRSQQQDASPLVCIFNFTPVPQRQYQVGVPHPGKYTLLFDSDALEFGGSQFIQQKEYSSISFAWQGRNDHIVIDLPPLCGLILQNELS